MNEHPHFVIFYSWQSDLPNATNRGFIQEALERAARNIRADDSIKVEPVIDRDTAGVPGAPDIASTIYEKIERASGFVSDVSIVSEPGASRQSPNPNVLLELGYAIRARGWSRIVMVMNTHYGSIDSLPFDLRGRRVVPYEAAPNDTDRARVRQPLIGQLEAAIRALIAGDSANLGERVEPLSIAAQAEAAIEQSRPNRVHLVRRFMANAIERLTALAPDLAKQQRDREGLLRAAEQATAISAEFASIASLTSSMNDIEAAEVLFRGLEPLAERFHLQRGFSGTFWEHQFDFFRFFGLEWLLILVACLLRDRRWDALSEILEIHLRVSNSPYQNGPDHIGLGYFSMGIRTLATPERISGVADLLKARFSKPPLSDVVSFTDLQDADYFLFLRLELLQEKAPDFPEWFAHTLVFSLETPRFLLDALRHKGAVALAQGLGVRKADNLRNLLTDRGRSVVKIFGPNALRIRLFPEFDFSRIGLD